MNTLQMDIKMKLFNRIALFHMLGMIGYICFVLPAAYFYFDNPYIVYSLLSIVIVLGLLKAFEEAGSTDVAYNSQPKTVCK